MSLRGKRSLARAGHIQTVQESSEGVAGMSYNACAVCLPELIATVRSTLRTIPKT